MTTLQAILSGVLAVLLAFGGGTWYGIGIGEDREFAKRAREEAIVEKVSQAAQASAAEAIAKIKPQNVTIKQEVEREIRTNTVYADCRNTPGGMRGINEALTGKRQPSGDRKLPGTGSPDG